MKKINILLKQYIKENLFRIILIYVFFIIGIILSVVYSQMLDINIKLDFTKYLETFNQNILNGEYVITYYSIIKNTIKYILIDILIILILGYTVVLSKLIYCLFAYKGFEIGFCLSIAIMLLGNIKGTIYGVFFMILSNIILITFEILISIMWLKFSKNVLRENSFYSIKKKIRHNTIITMFVAAFLIAIILPINIIINMNIHNFLNIL